MSRVNSVAAKASLAIGSLVLVMCVGLALVAYNSSSSAVMEEVEQALMMQAEEASHYVESRFQTEFGILEAIAERPEVKAMREAQRPSIMAEVERLPQVLALGLIDNYGVARYTDGTTDTLADKDYVKRALAGEAVVTDPVFSEVDGSLVLMYAVPVIDFEEIKGALLARQDASILRDMAERLGFGESGWGYIFHRNGTILAHPNHQYVLDQVNIFDETGTLANLGRAVQELGDNTGVISFVLDNVAHVSALTPIPSTDWVVGIGALEDDVLANVNQLRTFLVLISAGFILLGVIVAFVIARTIAKPLQEVQAVLGAVADGDLTKTATVRSNDEIGKLSEALNMTVENLKEVIGRVSNATSELAGTSQQMAAASEEVSASIEEVASTTNRFSSSLDVMNANAQKMESTAQDISNQALQGESAIRDIVKQMNGLRENTQDMSDDVSNLGTLSDEIGKIVDVISAIADQTNLLALNAAIEAARAGEHGRGFAVVADEVRKLAEQSAEAASEITTLISQIQGGISSTVNRMESSADQTVQALGSVEKSGQLLRGILGAVEGIVDQVQEISAGIEDTNSGGREIASATEEQAASIQQVAQSAQDLTNMGLKLQELVHHFTLEDETV